MSHPDAIQKLTVPQIIEDLKNTGVTFNFMDEQSAMHFLKEHNFYYRLKQYEADFDNRSKKGKIIGLDFAHLVELSTIDMYFRKILLKMTIDLEHYLKVKLVNDCQSNSADDGFYAAEAFLAKNPSIKLEVVSQLSVRRYGDMTLPEKIEDMPVWTLVELLGFHDFISFYIFYYDYFHLTSENVRHLDSVRRIRNAAAHNDCMLSSLKSVQNFKFDTDICFDLVASKLPISPTLITSCMKVPVLNDFAVMLFVYNSTISAELIKQNTFKEILDFFDGRMIKNKNYFSDNMLVKNAYNFSKAVLSTYIK